MPNMDDSKLIIKKPVDLTQLTEGRTQFGKKPPRQLRKVDKYTCFLVASLEA
jgi:hypothetical protein